MAFDYQIFEDSDAIPIPNRHNRLVYNDVVHAPISIPLKEEIYVMHNQIKNAQKAIYLNRDPLVSSIGQVYNVSPCAFFLNAPGGNSRVPHYDQCNEDWEED